MRRMFASVGMFVINACLFQFYREGWNTWISNSHCQQFVQDVADNLNCMAAALITYRVLHKQNTAGYSGGLANF